MIEIIGNHNDTTSIYIAKRLIEKDIEFSYTSREESKILLNGKEVSVKELYNFVNYYYPKG